MTVMVIKQSSFSYRAANPDVVKPPPVILMAVNHHHAVILLRKPLGLQVDFDLLPHGVHPHCREQPLGRHRNFHYSNLN